MKRYKAIVAVAELEVDGIGLAPAIKSFSNGEMERHVIRHEGEFYLCSSFGEVVENWPPEIIKSIGSWLRTRCFSCEVNPQKYVTGLCEECNQIAINASKLLDKQK